jgi:tRNA-splicing endonuclease subunit Sen2
MFKPKMKEPKAKRVRHEERATIPWPAALETILLSSKTRPFRGKLNSDHVQVDEGAVALSGVGFFGEGREERRRTSAKKYANVRLKDFVPKPARSTGFDCEDEDLAEEGSDNDVDNAGEDDRVRLSFCEAFFLSYALGCLVVVDVDEEELDVTALWCKFCRSRTDFPFLYAVYHHFRSRGWAVRHGSKFGSDFLLYKDGPAFFHASYSVSIEVEGPRGIGADCKKLNWHDLIGLNRVTESAAKELLLARVRVPEDVNNVTDRPDCLRKFNIVEVLVRRWLPSLERNQSK